MTKSPCVLKLTQCRQFTVLTNSNSTLALYVISFLRLTA